MKKIIEAVMLLIMCINCYAQRLENGIYGNPNGLICVSGDTVFIDVHKHSSYFYGSYSLHEGEIVFGYNKLIGRNATIKMEECSPDSIEIKLICKYGLIVKEEDKNPRQSMRCIFYSESTGSVESKCDGCIYIGLDENKDKFNVGVYYVQDYEQYQYREKINYPLVYGTRYVINQKYIASALFLDGDTSWLSFKVKKRGKRIEMYHKRAKTKEVFYYEGECSSCLEEFKKQFPGLIE